MQEFNQLFIPGSGRSAIKKSDFLAL